MKPLKWKVQFEVAVDPAWIEDGFNLTKSRVFRALENDLSGMGADIKNIVILEAPVPKLIQWLQGYFGKQGDKTELDLTCEKDRKKCQALINRGHHEAFNNDQAWLKEFTSNNS